MPPSQGLSRMEWMAETLACLDALGTHFQGQPKQYKRLLSLITAWWSGKIQSTEMVSQCASLLRNRPRLLRDINCLLRGSPQEVKIICPVDAPNVDCVVAVYSGGVKAERIGVIHAIPPFESLPQLRSSKQLEDGCWDQIHSIEARWAPFVMELLQIKLEDTCNALLRNDLLKSLRLLNKLHGALPLSIFIHDVCSEGKNPVAGGGFSDIWKGRRNGKLVCLKVLRYFSASSDKNRIFKDLSNEVLLWKQLRHQNILPLYGVNMELFQPRYCIISPWMQNGDIGSYLSRSKHSTIEQKLAFMLEIAEGLAYLHELEPPVIHGDIKGANVLISDNLHCCLADFGLSVIETQTQSLNPTSSASIRGSMRWLAPELINPPSFPEAESGRSKARDIYAFACTVVEILTGGAPFIDCKNDAQVMIKVLKGGRPDRPSECADELWTLLQCSWSEDIDERPTARLLVQSLVVLSPRANSLSHIQTNLSPQSSLCSVGPSADRHNFISPSPASLSSKQSFALRNLERSDTAVMSSSNTTFTSAIFGSNSSPYIPRENEDVLPHQSKLLPLNMSEGEKVGDADADQSQNPPPGQFTAPSRSHLRFSVSPRSKRLVQHKVFSYSVSRSRPNAQRVSSHIRKLPALLPDKRHSVIPDLRTSANPSIQSQPDTWYETGFDSYSEHPQWNQNQSAVSSPVPLPSPNEIQRPFRSSHDSTLKPLTTRIRSTLEWSLRAVTRSRKMPVPVPDDFGTIQSKGKERADIREQKKREKEKSGGMLRRLKSQVNFRRSGRDSATPSPSPALSLPNKSEEKVRAADRNSYITSSLAQSYVSSPALHLSSQALPSPKSQPVVPALPSLPNRKRFSPSGLPTVRSGEGSVFKAGGMMQDDREEALVDHDLEVKDVPTPPPRSPLRARSRNPANIPDDARALLNWARANASPPRADSTRAFVGEEPAREDPNPRQSTASAMTDVTASKATTVLSSLMDVGRNSSAASSKFETIRTITTETTSESPFISRTEGSSIADDIRKRGLDHHRERKLTVVDPSRVAEETDESGSSRRGKKKEARRESEGAERIERIRLGEGKWPDDFMDIQNLHASPTSPSPSSPLDMEDRFKRSTSHLSNSPRNLAVVDGGRRNENVESLPHFPRRPTHRARHSIDTTPPVLLPKDAVFRRDVSPDGLPSSSRLILRRNNSAKPTNRNGVLTPRGGDDPRGSDNETAVPVPFPRTVSGEHTPARSSDNDHSGSEWPERPALDVPRHPRGRFQSDVEGMSSRRRGRPNSYDELGAKPIRSRFASMVNLGGPSGHTSASDLLSRDSIESSGVRKPLIIKEEGKLPTHLQLGNCIGRGQFGSVYRALNLNTGQTVAVKRIRLDGLKEEEVTQLMREVDLVKRLSHPSIVKYEGMHRDSNTLNIVMEYAENGSLAHTIKAFGKLDEKLVASYVVRILEGLHYLHQSGVVHCDLKATNILTSKNGNVKLSDFGVSLNVRALEREIKDVAGTPNWMAPEVIELKGASPKSDIWSLACTVIELLTGRPPYGDIPNSLSVMFYIIEDDMPPIPPGCSPLLEDFLKKCFNKDPTQRPSAELLCEHQWLKQNWGAYKELRPQDSIPFLRRVSADLQKSEAVRYLSQIDMDGWQDHINASPPGRRMSNTSMRPSFDNEIAPREHSFVKTTFNKPMNCRVCMLNVKKSAVLCEQCSLICHSKCAPSAPSTCDLRAQLLLYAQYAEKGNPGNVYSNPIDVFSDAHPRSPMSDVQSVSHIRRTNLDTNPPIPAPPSPSAHSGVPPTAFQHIKFINAFKRPKHHAGSQTSVLSSPPETDVVRKPIVLRKNHDDHPQSLGSISTNPRSSVRSVGRRSTVSDALSPAIGGPAQIPEVSCKQQGTWDDPTLLDAWIDYRSRQAKKKTAQRPLVDRELQMTT